MGDLSEGVHDGLELSGHLEGNGVLEELSGGAGNFDEGTTLDELSGEIDGVIDGVDGVVVADGVLVVGGSLVSDDVVDDDKVLSVLDEVVGGGLELGLGLGSESGGGGDGLVGLTKNVVSITDFLGSVGDFSFTLGLLGTVDLVVGDLLGVDGILESLKNKSDGLDGTSVLELGFDLKHDVHDRSLLGEVKRVSGGV